MDETLDEDGRGHGYAEVFHKGHAEISPYRLPNEFICGEIGRFLRLPIPPFALTKTPGSDNVFSSLDFNIKRESLPAIVPDFCVKAMPAETTGVLLFDILIANEDRHDENLLVDRVDKPRELQVFDHDQALFGGAIVTGAERLWSFTATSWNYWEFGHRRKSALPLGRNQ